MTPLVSVVIPTYNRPGMLTEAVRSALTQTVTDLEVIVSENAGPAVSESVVQSFGDRRLVFRRNPANLGIAGNIREASRVARAEFIVHLHDDNTLEPTFVERHLAAFDGRPEVDVVFADEWVMDAAGAIDARETDINTARWKRDKLAAGTIRPFVRTAVVDQSIPPTCLFRRSVVDWDRFPTEADSTYDWYLLAVIAARGGAAVYLPERLCRHRLHGGHETAAALRPGRSQLFCMEQLLIEAGLADVAPYLADKYTHDLATFGLNLIRAGRGREGRSYLRRSLARRVTGRAMVGLGLSFAPWGLRLRDRMARGRE